MREIKFRVWEKEENVMHGWDEIKECADFPDIEDESGIWMQYTGFNDDKDKEIYEGDIVNFEDFESTESGHMEMPCTGEVFWDDETGSWCVTERLSAESYEVLDGECRVVGNIYENPELLEGAEQ